MDPELLPEVTERVTARYLEGLHDGGWSGPHRQIRRAIAASGAAKYSWFGPAVVGRAVSGDLGTSSYRRDSSVESVVSSLTGLMTLLADWSEATSA